jgi:hypothetical protein
VLPYAHPQLFKVFKHLIYVWHGCGMQFERFYSLNDSVVGSFPRLQRLGFQPALPNLGKPLWWQRYDCAAHPQLFKVFKHLIYVWHRCGMQFERFYSLNDSILGSFLHLHRLGFQPALPNLGIPLWWQRYECAAICPSTVWHRCGMQFERF